MEVRRCWNNLVLDDDYEVVCKEAEPLSPNEIIVHADIVFDRPVICMVDSDIWGRKDWDCVVPVGAVVRFVELPRGGGGGSNPFKILATIALAAAAAFTGGLVAGMFGTFAGALASAAVMVGGSLLIQALFGSQRKGSGFEIEKPDDMYSINAGGNRLRIGEPYAETFGRMKIYPDLTQMPYTSIKKNDEYLYFMGIIGIGDYEIEGVYIDQTPMKDYAGTDYRIIKRGCTPQLVKEICWTCKGAGGQTIKFGEWLTFTVNPSGTKTTSIEFDVVFGGGLVKYNDEGGRERIGAGVITEVRQLDDNGKPVTGWMAFRNEYFESDSKDPVRYSIREKGIFGDTRYEFRIMRAKESPDDSRCIDKMTLGGLRAYGNAHPKNDKVTMIECVIKASDQLSGEVANKINVIATRKLPSWSKSGSTSRGLQPTRSPLDAIVYILASKNGGMLGWGTNWGMMGHFGHAAFTEQLFNLKEKVAQKGWHFDWRFTSRMGVMDAIAKVAKLIKCVPYMPGGKFALVEDKKQSAPTLMFSAKDITENSLSIKTDFRTEGSPTCVRASYMNPVTWQGATVDCFDEQGSEQIPLEIALDGCTNRQHAYEIGMYLYRDMMRTVTTVTFDTGLKGHLATMFSKVLVADETVDWGASGVILSAKHDRLVLSEPVDFKGEATGQLYISNQDGSVQGPITVTPLQDPDQVKLPGGMLGGVIGTQVSPERASHYIFGAMSKEHLFVRIMRIAPKGQNEISIMGQVIDNSIYDIEGVAPGGSIGLNHTMSAGFFYISNDAPAGITQYRVFWNNGRWPSYFIEASTSGRIIKTEEVTGSSHILSLYSNSNLSDVLTIKITPRDSSGNLLQKKTVTAGKVEMKTTIEHAGMNEKTVENIQAKVTEDDASLSISWTSIPGAVAYEVELYVHGERMGARQVKTSPLVLESYRVEAIGGHWHRFTVKIAPRFNGSLGRYVSQEILLDVPVPQQFKIDEKMGNGLIFSWNKVPGAKMYVIAHALSPGANPQTAKIISQTNEELAIINGLNVKVKNYFFIAAVVNKNDWQQKDLKFSPVLVFDPKIEQPDSPSGLRVLETLSTGVILTWDYKEADGFVIASGASSSFSVTTSTPNIRAAGTSSFYGLNISPGNTYYFRIAAYKGNNWNIDELHFSSAASVYIPVPQPEE